jgi:hypothetical protein
VVREFAKSLDRVTDLNREARSIVLLRTAMAVFPDLRIPDVVAEYSRGSVLTLEFGRRKGGFLRQTAPQSAATVDKYPGHADAANDLSKKACFTPTRTPAMFSFSPTDGSPCSISGTPASSTS